VINVVPKRVIPRIALTTFLLFMGLYASNTVYKRSKAPRFRLDHHVMVVVAVMEVAVTAEEDISDFGVRYFRYLIRQLVNDNTKA
jgi:hypothetical protein